MDNACYAVLIGRRPGIYDTWEEVRRETDGFVGASFKKYSSRKEAQRILGIHHKTGLRKYEIKQTELLSNLNALNIYIDGSIDNKDNIFSYAFVVIEKGEIIYKESNAEKNHEVGNSLNSASGELKAAMKALKYATQKDKRHIYIYHDNLSVSNLVDGTMVAKNFYQKQYVSYVHHVTNTYDLNVHFTKVKAHNGNKYNHMADLMARAEMKRIRSGFGFLSRLHLDKKEINASRSKIYNIAVNLIVHAMLVDANKNIKKSEKRMDTLTKDLVQAVNKKKILTTKLTNEQVRNMFEINYDRMVKTAQKQFKELCLRESKKIAKKLL